jgi:hypothetical protein
MNITQHVFVCSLRYQAFNEHAPYYHLWPVPFYSIFQHYLINGKIFEKKIVNKICFDFAYDFCVK